MTPLLTLRRARRQHPIVDLILTVGTAIAIAIVVQWQVAKPYRVPSASMEPTVLIGDRVIAARFLYRFRDPERGEIVVFHPNGQGQEAAPVRTTAAVTFVKRLVGLPGEWIGSVGGRVYVCRRSAPADAARPTETPGCRILDESYVSGPTRDCHDPDADFGPERLDRDSYFMMGDNRTNSDDSRCWGAIRRSQIIGRAFVTYWPLTRISVY